MPVISVDQFTAIADRIAAIYDLFLKVDQRVNAPTPDGYYQSGVVYPASLLVDLTGTGTSMVLACSTSGEAGNMFSFTMVDPKLTGSSLSSISTGTNFGISLQTDSTGHIISTPDDVVSFILSSSDFSGISVIFPVTGNTGGIVIPYRRTSFQGGVGPSTEQSFPVYTLLTLRSGTFGNKYTIQINDSEETGSQLHTRLNGPDLVIDLAGDPGSPTTTVAELATAIAAMQGSSDIFQYSTVANFVVLSQNPDEIVSVTEPPDTPIPFSGGGNGVVMEILLTPPPGSTSGTADPDVVQMVPAAQALDTGITAISIYAGVNVIDQFMAALANHFTRVGFAGGLQGFITANSILVHKNFSTINTSRTGNVLLASSVFRPDIILLATLNMTGSGITFVAGTPLGTGSGTQSETNFGPQQLVAILEPAGGTLAADMTFTISLMGDDGLPKVSNPITFVAGTPSGSTVIITAPSSTGSFYSVIGATWTSGGSNGDQVIINQLVERQITL